MYDINESIRECVREEIRRMLPELLPDLMQGAGEDDEEFIDTKAAAELTGLSRQFFEIGRCKRHPNQPRHYKVGRRVLYSRSELLDWLRQCREA